MQPVNININDTRNSSKDISKDINNKDVNNKEEDYSEFQKYIIKNNIHLTNENKELRDKIKLLEEINSDNLNEIDKYDERIRYMRGLLHNLYTLKELSMEVKDGWENYVKEYYKIIKEYTLIEKYITKIFQIYIFYLFIILSIDKVIFGGWIMYFKLIFYNLIVILGIYYTDKKNDIIVNKPFLIKYCEKGLFKIEFKHNIEDISMKQVDLLKKTNEKKKEIKELEDSCVGVSVMIDNI